MCVFEIERERQNEKARESARERERARGNGRAGVAWNSGKFIGDMSISKVFGLVKTGFRDFSDWMRGPINLCPAPMHE